jgi:hypothetical protein
MVFKIEKCLNLKRLELENFLNFKNGKFENVQMAIMFTF